MDVEKARKDTEAASEKLRSDSAAASDRANAWVEGIQQSWRDHVAEARRRMDGQKVRHDARSRSATRRKPRTTPNS
jgi:hypothetical protein